MGDEVHVLSVGEAEGLEMGSGEVRCPEYGGS